MARKVTYTDEQLIAAVTAAQSWREALRLLGLSSTSAGSMRSIRFHADRIGIDHSHFRGQRSWTTESLRAAIASSDSWSEVVSKLSLSSASAIALVKGRAARLHLKTSHLVTPRPEIDMGFLPSISNLDRAGSLLAAAWFALCGAEVSWPLEPSRYDLVVSDGMSMRRVQVKTTTVRANGTWKVYLSTSGRERSTYDPDDIDDFFIIDGSLTTYLIPLTAVGGLHAIHLRAYDQYRLPPVAEIRLSA